MSDYRVTSDRAGRLAHLQTGAPMVASTREVISKEKEPALHPVRDIALLYSVADAARLLGIGKSTLWGMISRGEISTRKIGMRTLIHRQTLERFAGVTQETR
jgi:excisionase family DNA binding protein